jgi:hypothetical protein
MLMMRILMVIALGLIAVQEPPQTSNLVIEGRVLRKSTSASVPDTLIILSKTSQREDTSSLAVQASASTGAQIATLRGFLNGRPPDRAAQIIADNMLRTVGAPLDSSTYVFSDSAGRFSFKNLAPGHYTVRVLRDGYFGPKVNGTYLGGFARSIDLQPDTPIVPIDVFLTQGGEIRGTVGLPIGQQVAGLPVEAYREVYRDGQEVWDLVLKTTTDRNGLYTLRPLPPGDTYLRVTPRNSDPVFHPAAVAEIERASKFLVKEAEVAFIDFQIQPKKRMTFSISGTAFNGFNPSPTTDRSASAFLLARRDPAKLDPPYTILQNTLFGPQRASGEFELKDLESGSYELIPYYSDRATRRTLIGRATLEVRGGNVTGVSVPIRPGFTISGELLFNGPGADSIKPESLYMELESLGYVPKSFVTNPNIISIDERGRFGAFNVPEERYRFRLANLPPFAYLEDIRHAGQSVLDDGVGWTGRDELTHVMISTRGQTVSGLVRTADGRPVLDSTVVLVPPESQRKNPMRYRTVNTDAEGAFKWQDVPPGQYTVFAWESVLPTAWLNAKFLEKYRDLGRPLNVTAGFPLDLRLTAIPDAN